MLSVGGFRCRTIYNPRCKVCHGDISISEQECCLLKVSFSAAQNSCWQVCTYFGVTIIECDLLYHSDKLDVLIHSCFERANV